MTRIYLAFTYTVSASTSSNTTLLTFVYISCHYNTMTHSHQTHFTRHIFGLNSRRETHHRERWDLSLTHRSESLSNREAPASPVSGFLPNTDILYQSLWTGHRLIVSRNLFRLVQRRLVTSLPVSIVRNLFLVLSKHYHHSEWPNSVIPIPLIHMAPTLNTSH
jgi:hypothetical protein